eukprot:COSAG05_NODE_53_length_23772_cov_13.856630_6_plen_87_part_00
MGGMPQQQMMGGMIGQQPMMGGIGQQNQVILPLLPFVFIFIFFSLNFTEMHNFWLDASRMQMMGGLAAPAPAPAPAPAGAFDFLGK